jgi:hypothetical protein
LIDDFRTLNVAESLVLVLLSKPTVRYRSGRFTEKQSGSSKGEIVSVPVSTAHPRSMIRPSKEIARGLEVRVSASKVGGRRNDANGIGRVLGQL